MERSKRGILRKSEVILVDTGGMLPQRERCTQGHAKRETAMFYFINPDITKHDGIGAASYFEVEDLNQKSVKIKSRNSVRADWKQQVLGRCNG